MISRSATTTALARWVVGEYYVNSDLFSTELVPDLRNTLSFAQSACIRCYYHGQCCGIAVLFHCIFLH